MAAYGKKDGADARQFSRQISKDEKIQQALNRLTFGARPGDADQVRKIGLKKWIDRQLHPESIAENPVLAEKLKYLDTLDMSSAELVRNYPTPQLVKAMVAGKEPLPTDPDRRRMIEKLVERAEKKQGDAADSHVPEPPKLHGFAHARRSPRAPRPARPQQRLAALQALPPEKQDDVIAALPAGRAPGAIRHGAARIAPQDRIDQRSAAGGGARSGEGKLLRAIYSNRQLDEVLTDFWFNHFNVFLDKGADRYLVTEYERDVIRPHVLGKFRDLLEATAKSPAMLFYLDNWQSVGPDTPQAARRAKKRPRAERKLRPRAAGTAHARRGRRLHAEGRHRSGALLHRLDHRPAAARRRVRVQPTAAR